MKLRASTSRLAQLCRCFPQRYVDTRRPRKLRTASRAIVQASAFASAKLLRASKGEHEQLAAPARPPGEVRQSRPPLANIVGQARRYITGDQNPHVPANACINRDILLPIRTRVGDGIADDT